MKNLLYIIVFLPAWLNGQSTQYNFSRIDDKVLSIPFAKTEELAKQLAALGNTDREKVRAIFRWITENIDYNAKIFSRSRSTGTLFYDTGLGLSLARNIVHRHGGVLELRQRGGATVFVIELSSDSNLATTVNAV